MIDSLFDTLSPCGAVDQQSTRETAGGEATRTARTALVINYLHANLGALLCELSALSCANVECKSLWQGEHISHLIHMHILKAKAGRALAKTLMGAELSWC